MKFVKWCILLVACLLGLLVLITSFLPRDFAVERTLVMEAPPEVVYRQVVDLKAWQEWNPWSQMDPDMMVVFGDTTTGAGAGYAWRSDVAGNGQMNIIEAIPYREVRYKLVFEGFEDLPSYSSMLLKPGQEPGSTSVTWTFKGTVGNKFFARWMSVMVDKFVGASYERGLNALKIQCEEIAEGRE